MFIKVVKPSSGEKPISYGRLTEYIQSQDLLDIDFVSVKKAFKQASGKPVRIAKRPTGLGYTSRFKLEISDDRMRCFLTLLPPRDKEALTDPVIVMDELKNRNVEFGIKEDEIKKAIDHRIFRTEITIAEGKYPVLGRKTEFMPLVPCEMNLMDFVHDHSLDEIFNEFELIHVVEAGDIVAEMKPATAGTPGISIFNDPVSTLEGETIDTQGRNILVDGNHIKAKTAGRAVLKSEGIDVEPVMVLDGELKRKIAFDGSIKIMGDIESPCTIRASGDIEIHGMLSDASLSAGRNIFIHGNLVGPSNKSIVANGDFAARSISNSSVRAANILVSSTILNSEISAYRSVANTGEKGRIVGGHTRAGFSVESRCIGHEKNIPTRISVATPEIMNMYENRILAPYVHRMNRLKKESECIQRKLKQVKKMRSQPVEMEPAVFVVLRNLLETELSENERKISDVRKEIARIKDPKFGMETVNITADRFYSETILALGGSERGITGLKERVRFRVKGSYLYSELLDKKES